VCVIPWRTEGAKWVDASSVAVRVRADKAVSAEEDLQWQVLMESVGRKSGRLEHTSAWKGQETVVKTWRKVASQWRERAVTLSKRGNTASQGRAGGTKEKPDMGG